MVMSGWKRLAPSGLVGGHLQNSAHARGLPVVQVLIFFE